MDAWFPMGINRLGLFWQMSPLESILDRQVAGGGERTVGAVLQDWRIRVGHDLSATLAMALPAAHAKLLANGSWQSYGFPVPEDGARQGRLGLLHVPSLWKELPRQTLG